MFKLFLKNRNGQGLVQAIIAGAIMSIIVLAMISMQSSQAKENRALAEKLAALDLQRFVTATLANSSACSYHVSLLANPTFNTAHITAAGGGPSIDLGNVLLSNGTATSPAIVTVGEVASPVSNSLVVSSIKIVDINCPAPCPNPVLSNQFTANITINFDSSKLIRSILPVKSQIVLNTTGVGAVKTITSCLASGPGTFTKSSLTTREDPRVCHCNADEIRTGCAGIQPA